jgi:hypothetical protein
MEKESQPLVSSETIKVYKTASYTLKANRAYLQRQKEANKEEFLAKKSEYMRAYRLKQKLKKQDTQGQETQPPTPNIMI